MPRAKAKPNGRPTDHTTAVAGPHQPVRVPTGQPYGQATKLAEAQAAVPLPDERAAMAPDPVATAEAFNPFAGVTPIGAPSNHPAEPVTAGLAVGAGPGPEVLATPVRNRRVADTLAHLAAASQDPLIAAMAARAAERGQ